MISEFFNLPWPRIALLFGFFYLLFMFIAWIYADRMLFPFPEPKTYTQNDVDFFVSTKTGLQIACIQESAKKPNGLIILYSHGNGEDLGMLRDRMRKLTQSGCDVFAYDYPGYGLSEGTPSEEGCYQAIDALYAHILEQTGKKASDVVIWGRSLGTGPSCYLASKIKVAGLLLETPFLSAFRTITEITVLPWDRFRNLQRVALVKSPSLVIHGRWDEVIPFRQGRRIHNELHEPKTFLEIKEASHNDLVEKGGQSYKESIKHFLSGLLDD